MMYIAEHDSKQIVITVWDYLIPLMLGFQGEYAARDHQNRYDLSVENQKRTPAACNEL